MSEGVQGVQGSPATHAADFSLARAPDSLLLGAFLALSFVFVYGPAVLALGGDAGIGSLSSLPEALGLLALGLTLWRLGDAAVLDRGDWAAIALSALVLIHPAPWSPAVALTVAGLRLVMHGNPGARTAGVLCLGFAWIYLWGPLVFNAVSPWLLPLETWLAFALLAPLRSFTLSGTTIEAANGFSVVVLPACSAFSNTVRTAFLWLALGALCQIGISWRVVRFLAVALALIVLCNAARVGLMATSYPAYRFWHDGAGATVFSGLLLACALVPFLVMAGRPGPAQA